MVAASRGDTRSRRVASTRKKARTSYDRAVSIYRRAESLRIARDVLRALEKLAQGLLPVAERPLIYALLERINHLCDHRGRSDSDYFPALIA